MDWLVRKIARKKWLEPEDLPNESIGADAITADLRTGGNRLSLWTCVDPDNKTEIEEIALALGTRLNRSICVDLAWVEAEQFESIGIAWEKTPGDIFLDGMDDRHVDLIRLDQASLSNITSIFAQAIKEKQWHKRIPAPKLLMLLVQAVRDGRLSLDKFGDEQKDLQEEISRMLTKIAG
ncbi:MAG: hypothetical protein ACLQPD_34615, partial [Desulfomonilaceae bacterium]